jgi:5'-nucleotidase/UDP-sugar diphosphatase
VALPGRVILAALNHGVSKLPQTAGQFPQISGLTMRVDVAAAAAERVRDVRVGGVALDPERTYTVAIADFMLNGGDGYTMFAGQRVLTSPEAGDLLVIALEKYIVAKREVAPEVEGRIRIE